MWWKGCMFLRSLKRKIITRFLFFSFNPCLVPPLLAVSVDKSKDVCWGCQPLYFTNISIEELLGWNLKFQNSELIHQNAFYLWFLLFYWRHDKYYHISWTKIPFLLGIVCYARWKGHVARKIGGRFLGDPGLSFITDLDLDVKANSSDFLHLLPPMCNVELGW